MIEHLFASFLVGVMFSLLIAIVVCLIGFIIKEWQFVLCLVAFVAVMVGLGLGVRSVYNHYHVDTDPKVLEEVK